MSDEITESAKAVQEVAKTTGKAVDALAKSGSFFARHIDAPLEAAIGRITDRLQYSREVNRARLFVRFQEEMQALGLDAKTKKLPLGFAVDAIEQGSLEDDNELQDLWVRLLTNAAQTKSGVEPRRAYISMLKDFTALDAIVFDRIYSLDPSPHPDNLIRTTNLPDSVEEVTQVLATDLGVEPSDQVKVSISNLARLGLLYVVSTNQGDEMHSHVRQTFSGKDLMRAIRRRQN